MCCFALHIYYRCNVWWGYVLLGLFNNMSVLHLQSESISKAEIFYGTLSVSQESSRPWGYRDE